MGKVILTQDEMPFPDDRLNGNKINKFRYRIVNSNRNQTSDWSIINYIEQDVLKYEGTEGLPPGGSTGQIPSKESDDDYDVGWSDVIDLIPSGTYAPGTPPGGGNYVSTITDANKLIPIGGSAGQILAKQSGTNYDADWENRPAPDEVNFSIGTSFFA